jgi:hypothetical protein
MLHPKNASKHESPSSIQVFQRLRKTDLSPCLNDPEQTSDTKGISGYNPQDPKGREK